MVGICIIATGKYDCFIEQFLNSLVNFCPGHEKRIYLFTDNTVNGVAWGMTKGMQITYIKVEHRPFPYPTLMRYHWMSQIDPTETDYLFYSDVDMRMVNVGDEILNPLTAVLHPGFYMGGGSWETNPASLAYIPKEKRLKYYAGGFQGGKTEVYLEAVKRMRDNIQQDLDNGITAVWQDESHWNKYLTENPFTELTPAHCYAESWNLPFEKKILALDKDHNALRY